MINLDFKEDRIWLNEREEDIKNPRLQNCLKEILKCARRLGESYIRYKRISIMLQKMRFLHTWFEKIVNGKGFDRCLKNIQILSYADGKCKAQFTVAEEHLSCFGLLHGGFTSSVIDVISSYALMSYQTGKPAGASVDLHVTFLKAAFPGEVVTVNAKTICAGKTLGFLAVELTKNDGKDVVARGQHTKFLMPIKK